MKLLLGLVFGLCIGGCVVTTHDYSYIYLGDKMEVLRQGQSSVGSLFFHDDMPIEYRLRRADYTLVASLDTESVRPAVYIYLGDETPRQVSISGEFGSPCFGDFMDGHAAISRPESDALYFMWKKSMVDQCVTKKRLDESDKILSIMVTDFSGHVIAREDIPFAIKQNGVFLEYDGL